MATIRSKSRGTSPLRAVVGKELTVFARTRRLAATSVVVVILLAAATTTAWLQSRRQDAERAGAAAAQQRIWREQPSQNPHGAAHEGLYAMKPVMPLAVLDRGIDTFTGTVIPMQAHSTQESVLRPAADATALQRFGELTVAMLLQILLPLLLMFLFFDAVAGEREGGTLGQVMSTGVAPRTLVLGKLIAAAVVLGTLLVPLCISIIMVVVGRGDVERSDTVARAALLAAAYALYAGGFALMALGVSAMARSTRGALVMLLAVWIVAVGAAPRIAADVAARMAPAMTTTEFRLRVNEDIERGISGHAPRSDRAEEFRQDVLRRYNAARVEDLPVNFDGLLMQADEEYANAVYERHLAAVWDAYASQERWQLAVPPAAPLVALRTLSMELAGTGLGLHRDFALASEQYRRTLMERLNHDLTVNSRTGDWTYKADSALWASIPPFDYRPPAVREVVRRHQLPMVILVVWCGCGAAVAALGMFRLRAV